MEKKIVATGKTIDLALESALAQLGSRTSCVRNHMHGLHG